VHRLLGEQAQNGGADVATTRTHAAGTAKAVDVTHHAERGPKATALAEVAVVTVHSAATGLGVMLVVIMHLSSFR